MTLGYLYYMESDLDGREFEPKVWYAELAIITSHLNLNPQT